MLVRGVSCHNRVYRRQKIKNKEKMSSFMYRMAWQFSEIFRRYSQNKFSLTWVVFYPETKKEVSIKQPYHLITIWPRVSYADSIPLFRIYFPKKRKIVERPTTLNGSFSFFCSNYLWDCCAPLRLFVAMCLQRKVNLFRLKLLWSNEKPIHRQYITFELLSCLLTTSE